MSESTRRRAAVWFSTALTTGTGLLLGYWMFARRGSALFGAAALLRPFRARQPVARWLAAAAAGTGLLALLFLFATSLPAALAPLSNLVVGVGGTLGTVQLTAAVTLVLVAALAPARRWVGQSVR